MSSSLERSLTHVVLIVFSVVAVYPIVSIVLLVVLPWVRVRHAGGRKS